jgi:hypothetical protein
MKQKQHLSNNMKIKSNVAGLIALGILCSLIAQTPSALAKGGTTSGGVNSGGVNSGGTSSGGGGGGEGVESTTTAPNSPALPSGAITFTASGPVNGTLPVCTGDYRESAYYPTLLDMTVNVHVSSLDVPDGTVLYVNVVSTGGYALYPSTSNAIVVIGGSGSCSESLFIAPGLSLASAVVTDAYGNVVFVGN